MKSVRFAFGGIPADFGQEKTLLIQRRDTPEFLHLMRGFYKEKDINLIFSKSTRSEYDLADHIVNADDQGMENIITNYLKVRYHQNLEFMINNAIRKFKLYRETISHAINYNTPVKHQTYLWPKGGLMEGETAIECAQREIREETSLDVPRDKILNNTYKVDIHSFTGKVYTTIYYLVIIDSDKYIPTDNFDKREIQKVEWVSFDEARRLLESPYLDILEDLVNIMNESR